LEKWLNFGAADGRLLFHNAVGFGPRRCTEEPLECNQDLREIR